MTARPPIEVADIVRQHGNAIQQQRWFTSEHSRVLNAIESCRTAALGGHVEACDSCDHLRIAYNSCRNRHCPKCQGQARARWVAAREADLLRVPYFHVVFTLPHELNPLALANKRLIYNLLFEAASETLCRIGADPKHLGGRIGLLAVLHTWGQTLTLHPHLHCIVPGGAISLDGTEWLPSRKNFLFPVLVLAKLFRRLFLSKLHKAIDSGRMVLPAKLDPGSLISSLARVRWVVYAKRPFGGPRQVLRYLGRYTHRVAISNGRIIAFDGQQVAFTYKDYTHSGQTKVMRLDAVEFLRRFLLHVLPNGFHRIRQYGFLAHRNRQAALATCRRLLGVRSHETPSTESTGRELATCPVCKTGRMRIRELFTPASAWQVLSSLPVAAIDSS